MTTFARTPARSAARPGPCPSPSRRASRAAIVAAAACLLTALGGCANMEFQFANTMSPAKGSQRVFDPYDPGSPRNVWNAL
jgi:ferric-dicitrate binding protein FerR (iron transport regulator)